MRLLLALLLAAGAAAPVRAAGTHAAEFLRFPVGRPAARAGAGAAVDRGVSALYWNPAGLGGLRGGPQVYAAHHSLPQTLNYDFLGVAVPLAGRGTLAYGLQALSQADLPKVDNTGREVGSFGAFDQAHTLAWGSGDGPLRLGAGARYVRQSLEDETGSAVGLDLAAQLDRGPWVLGAAVSNFGTTLRLGREVAPLPLTYRVGAGLRVNGDRALLGLDLSRLDGEDVVAHLGGTVRPLPQVAVSFGYALRRRDADEPNGLAAGFGLDLGAFTADFVFQPFGVFGNAMQVAAGYRFGGAATPPEPASLRLRRAPPKAAVAPPPVAAPTAPAQAPPAAEPPAPTAPAAAPPAAPAEPSSVPESTPIAAPDPSDPAPAPTEPPPAAPEPATAEPATAEPATAEPAAPAEAPPPAVP